jgi:predicted unusual protein kinase regulating ubiquinone biosynthesis (AarF/ABC1/UbiB family)
MTNENLSQLIAALTEPGEPEFAAEAGLPHEQLAQILADLARRPVPVRSLHRLWTLGDLSAQVALAYLALWVRQWFADEETRKRRVMETNLRIALKMFRHLGYLRGAMTKLGQAAGNLPDVVPGQIAETLDRLHFEAPPMHFSLIREVVSNELGKDPEELFASFEKEAFAAASLGQVHRARLKSGEQVAVKIQYPGIARTIDADFRNLGALLFPVRMGKNWEYVRAQFAEIHRMLNQEIDYEREADTTRKAGGLFQPAEGFLVPRVFEAYSSRRVLTTEYLPGLHLRDFLATNPSQELRNGLGTKLYRAHFRMYYAFMNYADPHPGNYLFLNDGRLGLLDFGCVQYYGPEEREIFRLSERLINEDDSVIPLLLGIVSGLTASDPEYEAYRRMLEESRSWMMEPIRAKGEFDFGNEDHLKRGFDWFFGSVRRHQVRGHPTYVYFHRSVFGLKAMLYRLRAQVDVDLLHRQESEIWRRREVPQ